MKTRLRNFLANPMARARMALQGYIAQLSLGSDATAQSSSLVSR